ncbi:MAG: hypothetical protein CFE21_10320 [Bacteroidetes bacterium B1(2017)]|nr:MAG: hypothetical protein CFE21_10320 [Bacteroidetes bacterium B1(2017)]
MKKLCTLLVLGTLAISLQAQGIKDRFFQQVGFCVYTDFYFSAPKDYSTNILVDDINYNTVSIPMNGAVRNQEYSFFAYYYTPRINLKETGVDKSISLDMPIGIHLSSGYKKFAGQYITPGSTTQTEWGGVNVEYLGSISFPVYVSLNIGMGSTYASEKETGFSIGLGLDNRLTGFSVESNTIDGSADLPSFTTMPSVMLGFNRWKNDKAKAIKVKLSYMPATGDPKDLNTLIKSGFAFSLTFNRFLNF